ncbi:orotidine-5'-phosphate decarboxylase [Jeotgalibacillus campisalis]|uniref:Orotidine 5'-phosphate decarboxylase n=1 Tax=Jeotgalibacillus campisalis TaxID=220754 RepID=A0A0C2VT93_9BACL|nr:orotidine-5'-phosphate decarboxylase [Jeotgalibacillus campisalis]KIL47656.1 orotidine 5'-phosphate decarboxylase [Jeotgalibacillus campisalis]
MEKQPIIALDFSTLIEVDEFLNLFDEPLYVKVGMELYLQNGPAVIELIQKKNHKIFLDLKLHDIPTTVRKAMQGLASLGIDMINVHAAGGRKMMEEAIEGLSAGSQNGPRPKLIAVTQLTSASHEMVQNEQKSALTLEESVLHYANLAKISGLDGVVCSAAEAGRIKEKMGSDFLRITPGIRLEGDIAHDQVRIATPKLAMENGSSAIVVGRSITQSKDQVLAYHTVKREWEGAFYEKSNR